MCLGCTKTGFWTSEYVEETKKSVEADILLVSVDLNRYSEILYSNTNRFQQIIRSQKLLRRLVQNESSLVHAEIQDL